MIFDEEGGSFGLCLVIRQVAALEEDIYLDKVSVLVIGGMLVVSIPSALGVATAAGSGLLYCRACLTTHACCPFTCSHGH